MLTQMGYIVMTVDNRGINVPRGRAWRKIIYRRIGILASAEQAAAVKAIIKRWSYVDPERLGIWGHSGGGAMTLNMMFRYPDLFRMGMASAAVAHQRYYDSIYQEMFMGLPKDNPEGYKQGSPLTFASQLKGNLLIVHGTGDHNVHYQHAEMLANELVKHNKAFTMVSYPNRDHGLGEAPNTPLHRHETMTRYLKENLPLGAR
jgi:dipeptidyl-peptidase-4